MAALRGYGNKCLELIIHMEIKNKNELLQRSEISQLPDERAILRQQHAIDSKGNPHGCLKPDHMNVRVQLPCLSVVAKVN